MTQQEARALEVGDSVVYDPGYTQESGYITSIRKEEDVSVFVCYDGTGRGQLTPYKDLRR